jgi:uncharacterized protein (DUF697 family)
MEKSLLKSKTFWGGAVLFVAMILKIFGIELTPEDQAAAPELIATAIDAVSALVGFVLVIYGRKNAVLPIK